MNNNKQSDMTPAKRRQYILSLLQARKTVSVKELEKELFVNAATLRRDLNSLELTGMAKRTYGGAVLVEGLDTEIPLYARESRNTDKKDRICHLAAAYVKDGDTIMLDSSSTTARMIKFLATKQNLKIITNGAKTAVLLTKLPGVTIYCTGGKMRENSLSYIGQSAIEYIKNFHADLVFFSCRGLSDKGLTDSSDEEALLRRAMLQHSKKSVLLIDSTKLHVDSFFYICGTEQIDHIICDDPAYCK